MVAICSLMRKLAHWRYGAFRTESAFNDATVASLLREGARVRAIKDPF